VHRGSLDDLDSLRSGAAAADGVIHTAFMNEALLGGPDAFVKAGKAEQRAIEVLGETLAGSGRPLVVTSGTALVSPGHLLTEEDAPDASAAARIPRNPEVALALAARGVRVSVVRLPPSVHGEGDRGFVPALIAAARAQGMSAYPGDGLNHWASGHRLDAAHLYRLALESGEAGSRFHAVADEGVSVREIAAIIGRHLEVPVVSLPVEQAVEHFGWIGRFVTMDLQASSTLTQQRLGWHPVQPSLLEDLDQGHYFKQ
jgi:nucleoside-diphosphate-sugar epimerase